MRIYLLSILLLVFTGSASFAKPRWLKLMQSKDINYFKVTKKFDKYWDKHFHPSEEEEGEGRERESENEESEDPRSFFVRIFQSEERAKEKSNELIIDYKYFKKWRNEMLPYVKSNGLLMTESERLEAWKQLRKFD